MTDAHSFEVVLDPETADDLAATLCVVIAALYEAGATAAATTPSAPKDYLSHAMRLSGIAEDAEAMARALMVVAKRSDLR